MRVTLDANIWISAFNFKGLAQSILDMAEAGEIQLVTSEPIIDEVLDVLGRKFEWSAQELRMARTRIERYAEIVAPTEAVHAVPDDPDDDKILECAVASGSECLITGDKDLLRLGHFQGIQILPPADFLARRRGLK